MGTIEEQVVVYWSRKYQARCEYDNKRFLDFLEKLEHDPENFRVTALETKSLRRFFRPEYVHQTTGEVFDASKLKPLIDFDKVREFRKNNTNSRKAKKPGKNTSGLIPEDIGEE